jgi:hypothetical protein
MVMKQIVITTETYQFASYVQSFSNIRLSVLIPYAEEIIWDHRSGFRHNRSTTVQIIYIRKILEIKSECNGGVRQPYIYFKKACDSLRREVLCNILIESAILMKIANTLGYATTKVIGSRNSFVIAFLRSSIH